MIIEELLSRVDGVQGSAPQWSAKCPAHTDEHQSLSVGQGTDGRTLLKCHAGCETFDIVTAMGLEPRDLFGDTGSDGHGGGEIVATYNYTDEAGECLFEVVRFSPKTFRQRRPNGNGGWTWKLRDVRRVLYRLLELTRAVGSGGEVWVVEGEKDADRLASLGLTATTNPGGAGRGKWRREFADSLRGVHIYIIPDQDESGRHHGQRIAGALHGTAASVRIVELPGLPDKGDVSDFLDAGHTVAELLAVARATPEWRPVTMTTPPQAAGDGASVRPTIRVREELNAVTGEAITALHTTHQPVFVRSRQLVTVARDGSPRHRWLRRPPGSPVIVSVSAARMIGFLDTAAEWTKWNARAKGLVAARPPTWVGEQVLARLEWPFPYLEHVVEVPTIRPDGSILNTPGWDEGTGLLYEPLPGLMWPVVPEQPTTEDVRQAVAMLLDPVRDFPFVATSDRTAYLAAVLTLLARHVIDGPVPLFAIRAPAPATGKGLLATVIASIGTGREAAVSTMTEEAAEWRKLLLTVAIEGAPVVLLDNLSGAIGSDHLAAALTAREWTDRRLGTNEIVRAPLTTVWLATGNNLTFRRTLGRRVIPIDLDAQLERPEDRINFRIPDLVAHVRTHRPHYVAAGLTLLRAFHLAGKPRHTEGPRMGSFEAWDDLIRSAILWFGLHDPASTGDEAKGRGRVRAQAEEDFEEAVELLCALEAAFGANQWFSVQEVIARIDVQEGGLTERRQATSLRAAVAAVATPRKGGTPTGRTLGVTFQHLRDRPLSGRVLRRAQRGKGGQGARWTVAGVRT